MKGNGTLNKLCGSFFRLCLLRRRKINFKVSRRELEQFSFLKCGSQFTLHLHQFASNYEHTRNINNIKKKYSSPFVYTKHASINSYHNKKKTISACNEFSSIKERRNKLVKSFIANIIIFRSTNSNEI